MSKPLNPYEVLQIDDFSTVEEVEEAFAIRVREFDGIEKFSKKQAELYSSIHSAYDILTSQNTKNMVDEDLRLKNSKNQNIRVAENLSPHDEANIEAIKEEKELSRKKTIGIKGKSTSSAPKYIFYSLFACLIAFYFLNFSKSKDTTSNQEQTTQTEKKPTEEQVKSPPQQINLIAKASQIRNNVLYPDPNLFKKANLIHAPDGSVFPIEAGLIASLPQTTDGQGSIVIQNPHPTAVFGKLIVQFTESTEPMAIRYFYIPAKQTLELFKTPSGRFQIQILTLDKPVAYVSPVFTIPLYNEARVIQKADWAFPHSPDSVF